MHRMVAAREARTDERAHQRMRRGNGKAQARGKETRERPAERDGQQEGGRLRERLRHETLAAERREQSARGKERRDGTGKSRCRSPPHGGAQARGAGSIDGCDALEVGVRPIRECDAARRDEEKDEQARALLAGWLATSLGGKGLVLQPNVFLPRAFIETDVRVAGDVLEVEAEQAAFA